MYHKTLHAKYYNNDWSEYQTSAYYTVEPILNVYELFTNVVLIGYPIIHVMHKNKPILCRNYPYEYNLLQQKSNNNNDNHIDIIS